MRDTRILLADDTDLVRNMLHSRLEAAGFEVMAVGTTDEVRDLARRTWFHVIIMDNLGGGGQQLAGELIRAGARVIWTSIAPVNVPHEAIPLPKGGDFYVEQLIQTIDRALKHL